ncbi:MAG: hypothetical protein HDT39_02665 [Lachnospiraceae bacterium]|nr:hypothetical protein [Lachnospiraceae bacterium]
MKAFQLKIAIKNSKPPIWRRVIVPSGITFSQFSMILNNAMGWLGYHLFEFEFHSLGLQIAENANEMDYGYGDYDYIEAKDTFIGDYLEQTDWFTYTYDLGDDWQHKVTVEKIIYDYDLNYPQVIKYKEACPPEDCGGIYGYYEYLDIISDKTNPECKEISEWMQSQGYTGKYDMQAVNEVLKNYFFYKWGKGEKRFQSDIYEDHMSGKYGIKAVNDELPHFSDIAGQKYEWKWDLSKISLKEVFLDFTKEEIREIAKDKGLKGISKYNKEALADKLAGFMLQKDVMTQYFFCLQDYEIKTFEKIIKTEKPCDGSLIEELEKLYATCYLGMLSDGTIIVPDDVREKYNTIKDKSFTKKRKSMSWLLCCLDAMEILYGAAPIEIVSAMLATNPKIHLTEQEIKSYIKDIPPEFANYIIINDMVYSKEFYPDDRGLLAAQGNKKYYIPTMDEIFDLGTVGYLPNSTSLKKFIRYLVHSMNASVEKADFAGMMVQKCICGDCRMQDIVDVIYGCGILIENDSILNELIININELWNNTRMLLNRGFTPNDMIKKEINNSDKVISFEKTKKKKIYPNDKCPCGSGKKYKNCCGNTAKAVQKQ